MSLPPGPYSGPPPICFNCSKEGHFLVNCPEPKRTSIAGPLVAPPSNQSDGNLPSNQAPQWVNGRNFGAAGATVLHFPKPPPVVTRYAAPSQPPQYANSPGSYGPSPTVPPYQHPGSAPPGQFYPSPQDPYPSQEYDCSAPPYPHNPPPQSYSAPPPNLQYGQGYQPPPNSQYSTNGPPQYNSIPFQQYGPPTTPQYQSPVNQYPPRNDSYSAPPPPPQWNSMTPVAASSPFGTPSHQQPTLQRRNSSIQRDFSGMPIQQPPPLQQIPQDEIAQSSDGHQHTPQTPFSAFNLNGLTQSSQSSPVNESYFPHQDPPKSATPSVALSRASTPYGNYGFSRSGSFSSNPGNQEPPSVAAKSRSATPKVHVPEPIPSAAEAVLKEVAKDKAVKKDAKEAEEGEYTEEDLLQEQFNWDYKKIFKEPEPTESVALSQPLSYTYNVTPVPLMDPRWNNSVSRYARKDNLKEYLRPIRSQSQWDYLKEDPAFSDIPLEGPLVPLRDVRNWMEKRHGIEEVPEVNSEDFKKATEELVKPLRKRAWTDEYEHKDVDNQTQVDASIEVNEPNQNKRQKSGQPVDDDCIVVDTSETPAPGTPNVGRSGTPTFGVVDDAWAPEPGEAASAPMDPTEALLASLGVSGEPKPLRQQSNLVGGAEENFGTSSFDSIQHSMSPQVHASGNNTPHINVNPNKTLPGPQEGLSQNNPGYGNPQYNRSQQGSSPNGNPYGPPQPSVLYGNHGISIYDNNLPPQPAPTPLYGPPQQHGVPYGAPAPQRHPSYDNNQHGPPQGQFPLQGQYGPSQSQYPPQGQYGPSQPQYISPPHRQWGPPQGQYNGPPQNQWGPPQYGPPQYNGPPQSQWGPQQGQYNGPPQYNPPQGQWGPPHGQHPHGYPPGPPSQGPGPHYGPPHSQSPQLNAGFVNGPQQVASQLFNNQGQGNPPRQDSGYASARGSYSNGSGLNGFINGVPHQGQQQAHGTKQTLNPGVDGGNDTPPEKKKKDSEALVNKDDPKESEPEPIESPLSPTSAEILGKLIQPSKPRKIIRVISGKNKDASRQGEGDSPTKRGKRPAPVVAEAYSRRW